MLYSVRTLISTHIGHDTMKILKSVTFYAFLLLSSLFTVSCASLPALQFGTNAVLLESEFEGVRDRIRSLDLTFEERFSFEESVTVFEDIRLQLSNLAEGQVTTELLISVATADTLLDRSADAYLNAEGVVRGYYDRTQEPVPVEFIFYRDSAINAYNFLKEKTANQSSLPWTDITGFLTLALRSYVAVNTGV